MARRCRSIAIAVAVSTTRNGDPLVLVVPESCSVRNVLAKREAARLLERLSRRSCEILRREEIAHRAGVGKQRNKWGTVASRGARRGGWGIRQSGSMGDVVSTAGSGDPLVLVVPESCSVRNAFATRDAARRLESLSRRSCEILRREEIAHRAGVGKQRNKWGTVASRGLVDNAVHLSASGQIWTIQRGHVC